MLDQYIRKCMVSIINIDNGITKHTHGYQNCNTCQVLMLGGYVKVREYFNTQVIIGVKTIPNHIDTRVMLPRYESYCTIYCTWKARSTLFKKWGSALSKTIIKIMAINN